MAHGAPDYWSMSYVDIVAQAIGNIEVDIVAQAISEITNRPTYGAAVRSFFEINVGAGATVSLTSIAGTGMLYGGYLFLDSGWTHADDIPELWVDGVRISGLTLFYMNWRRITLQDLCPFVLTIYDEVHWMYGLRLMSGLTFESGLEIKWSNSTVMACQIQGEIIYATV
jgi:hypothetical protein